MNFLDLFAGKGSTSTQGTPTTSGAGDGAKADDIERYLGIITGVYSAVTGTGKPNSPAPAPQQKKTVTPTWMIAGGIALGVALLFLVIKKLK